MELDAVEESVARRGERQPVGGNDGAGVVGLGAIACSAFTVVATSSAA
ncbi:MAG: hypothetical protein ACRD0D_13585 [Acidimicrobiales bacterium]